MKIQNQAPRSLNTSIIFYWCTIGKIQQLKAASRGLTNRPRNPMYPRPIRYQTCLYLCPLHEVIYFLTCSLEPFFLTWRRQQKIKIKKLYSKLPQMFFFFYFLLIWGFGLFRFCNLHPFFVSEY